MCSRWVSVSDYLLGDRGGQTSNCLASELVGECLQLHAIYTSTSGPGSNVMRCEPEGRFCNPAFPTRRPLLNHPATPNFQLLAPSRNIHKLFSRSHGLYVARYVLVLARAGKGLRIHVQCTDNMCCKNRSLDLHSSF